MRVWAVLLLLCAVSLAGCAGEDADLDDGDDLNIDDGDDGLPELTGLSMVLDEGADLLAPFEGEFHIAADETDDNATWAVYLVAFVPAGDAGEATGDAEADATEEEGGDDNGTADRRDDNGTADADDNSTAEPEPAGGLLVEGTGLPANVTLTFDDAGMYDLMVRAQSPDHGATDRFLTIVLEEAEDAAEEIPVGPQETIVIEDSITDIGGESGPNVHTFELVSIPSVMTLTFDQGATAPDLDFYLFDPEGSQVDSRGSFECAPAVLGEGGCMEPPIVVDDPAHLKKLGEWSIEVVGYVAAAGSYTITIGFE